MSVFFYFSYKVPFVVALRDFTPLSVLERSFVDRSKFLLALPVSAEDVSLSKFGTDTNLKLFKNYASIVSSFGIY